MDSITEAVLNSDKGYRLMTS